ncbi:MAG TPA: hypothetical protein VLK82_12500, partial [Candidatus Tectomicrobia bacterium]|nr:hypothetical protein [Candidatus Tectomicrobia bacterium]
SFSKLILVVVLWIEGVIVWHVIDSPGLVDALWPLIWMFALTIAGSHGIKGLMLWFQAARLRTEARVETSHRELVISRRDAEEGIDPA